MPDQSNKNEKRESSDQTRPRAKFPRRTKHGEPNTDSGTRNTEHGTRSLRIVVFTSPSGAGKTTIAKAVLAEFEQLRFSVSATTRSSRPGEKDGEHYYFLSPFDFQKKIREDEFLEYEEVYPGLWYGTLMSEVERLGLKGGVLLDIDVNGAGRVKAEYADDVCVIFISPPSRDILRQRLLARGTESEEELQKRLARMEFEMQLSEKFDHNVLNDDLEIAIHETKGIVREFLHAPKKSKENPVEHGD